MKILIIGGSGFVSGTLARVAADSGHEVWAVTRGKRPLDPRVSSIVADRTEHDSFAQAIRSSGVEWDLVVDCIGYHPEDAEQDVELFLSDEGTARCRHFVFISTDFVYRPESRRFPQPESDAVYIESGYGYEKRICEQVIDDRATTDAWTILRPCHIYGPGSLLGCLPDHGRDPDLIETIRAGRPLRLVGGGTHLQQPIYVEDLARAALSAPEAAGSRRRICNMAGPEIIESVRYYQIIAELLGASLEVEEIPVASFRSEHPEKRSFLCHRIYTLDQLETSGIRMPVVGVEEALTAQVRSLT